MFLHGLRGDCLQKTAAAFRNVPPGGRKITRVPRVGHVAGAGGVVEQTVDFARRVAAADAGHIADVGAVHPDEQIVFVVVRPRHLPRRVRPAGHAVRCQFPPRGRIDRVADLLGAGGGGCDFKFIRKPGFGHKVFHYKFRHGAAANVAVAQKNYLCHSLHIPPQVFIMRYIALFFSISSACFSRVSTLLSITFQQNGVVMVYQTVLYQPDIFRSCRSDDPGKSTSFAPSSDDDTA